MQSIFGSQMRVLLDIFHAVQRISTKLSKRHPFHSQCVHDLSLVFRDPTDQGSVRTLETPAPTVLVDNLKKFLRKWKDVDHEGQKPITPVITDNCHTKTYGERMLVSHKSGKGNKQK